MKKTFTSPMFWAVYSILYFILMMAACIIAEGHMIGGGGNSDIEHATNVYNKQKHTKYEV